MSGLAKGLTEDQVLRRVVEKVCEQIWSQDETAIKEAFAELVRADEREACAKVCEDAPEPDGADLAERIRARGQDEFPAGIPFVTQDELERLRREAE